MSGRIDDDAVTLRADYGAMTTLLSDVAPINIGLPEGVPLSDGAISVRFSKLDDLVSLPGIGRKTANVILGNAFGIPGLTVDTHFQRLVRRWAWTDETDPVKIEFAVAKLIDKREWTMLSHRIIFHGRRVCHARKPACGACTLARWCPSYGTGPVDPVAAAKLLKGPRVTELAALAGVPAP